MRRDAHGLEVNYTAQTPILDLPNRYFVSSVLQAAASVKLLTPSYLGT